jgi:hypothetical protein
MFSQHVVHATPYPDGNHSEDNDEYWVGYDEQEHFSDTDDDKYKENPFGTEWQNKMNPTLLVIRSLPPGHLKTRHKTSSQLNPPTESIPTHLLVATLQQPAAKKTSPRGNPATPMGHHPHPSMELPPLEGETEDPTPLPLGPPSGPTNKLLTHSRPSEQEHQESSSVEITGQDYSTQWGAGKFTPSRGNYTVPPSEPWDPNPHPPSPKKLTKNLKKTQLTSITNARSVRLHWPPSTPLSP